MESKILARSLESDLELIYVAQMCLSWEALHYQYRKVESIINSQNEALFHNCTARDFQTFQVLLERFMEDEKCEGKRYSNFIHKRFSFKTLLQVPDVTERAIVEKFAREEKSESNARRIREERCFINYDRHEAGGESA
ncbi:uncharacterized protein Fot_27046 [Forsythia ovata]|uniref:Uncharacterized protein n=1 Tax=Forsythia ovata TaxID=205694 RepID=A0ABD1UDL7_9LAMI